MKEIKGLSGTDYSIMGQLLKEHHNQYEPIQMWKEVVENLQKLLSYSVDQLYLEVKGEK